MYLINAQIYSYKSIEDSGSVKIDPSVTILVGQNESGKTAFLQALHKTNSVENDVKFNVIEDYPRRKLNAYEKIKDEQPATVATLKFALNEEEINKINNDLEFELLKDLEFEVHFKYNGYKTIILKVDEQKYVKHLISNSNLTIDNKNNIEKEINLKAVINKLQTLDLNSEEEQFVNNLKNKFVEKSDWNSSLNFYIWNNYLSSNLPKFLYFDDYRVLPGKINLPELKRKIELSNTNNQILQDEDRTSLSLLQMAGVNLDDLDNTEGYESIKAKLESISNSITDKVFEYWKQNNELDVEFDIRSDVNDVAPYNNGSNLYIRIKNRRHRVTVPFSQRSKGFIWFFSFIVWFDSIKEQVGTTNDLILLLDEPGLSLHALAQADFLRYIEDLTQSHQIIYTTHSPFMVPNDKLHQVRMVEDKEKEGTKISSNFSSADSKTLFPLQAALGYTIAQNLFISKKNLLVEGPADLVYLRYFSQLLESNNESFLPSDITIVPVGGLDKLVTFVALLGANDLQLVVLHDFNSKPDQRLDGLVRDKMINKQNVINYAMFRKTKEKDLISTDVEDLFTPKLYLHLFNEAYKKELKGHIIEESNLPVGERIVERINRYLKSQSISLRPSGGFNHYLVADQLVSKSLSSKLIDKATISRFKLLFEKVNEIL